MNVIEVRNLKKYYGDVKAVDGISFEVNEGEIFGMVGPNGAGKTTTIECIEGLRKPDEGEIRVLDLNPQKDREKIYKLISIQLQETSYQDKIKVYEICEFFSSFYSNPLDYKKLLDKFGLHEFRNSYVMKLSGGQKQKLSILLALLPDPRIVFLDEITTGLDPKARREMWEMVKDLKKEGRVVFLTTHYMEEAEVLCDRVAIVDYGRIVALDTPEELVTKSGIDEMVSFEVDMIDVSKLREVKGVSVVNFKDGEVVLYGKGGDLLKGIVDYLNANRLTFRNLRTKKPNLEDTFLKLTGKKYEEEKDEDVN